MTSHNQNNGFNDRWKNTPMANLPHRHMRSANEKIELYQGPAIVHLGEDQLRGHCTVSFSWFPDARVEASLAITGIININAFVDTDKLKLTFPEIKRDEFVIFGGSGMQVNQDGSGTTITLIIIGHDNDPDIRAHKTQALLINGPDYRGELIRYVEKPSINCGRLFTEVDGWLITIDHIDVNKQLKDSLRHKSGYAFTHTITISRADKSPFTPSDSNGIIESLTWFFSFLCGRWCGITLPVYIDQDNNLQHEDWRWSPRLSTGIKEGWNIPIEPDEFRNAYVKFYEFIQSPGRGRLIRTAIHWYVQSSMGAIGPEGGIILNQTAFELLSYYILVDSKGTLSEDGYGRLPAADKLRLLLSQFNGQLSLPKKYHRLIKASKANNWTDGPETLVGLRNALVHRTNKKQQVLDRAQGIEMVEAWWLGLYYMELSIMWLIGYSGRYCPVETILTSCWDGAAIGG
ncbi:MAG: hypothetical protein R3C45_11580 [Phycisphaerales bacterium]